MKADAVLFDLDDTLMPEISIVDEAFEATSRLAAEKTGVDPMIFLTSTQQCARRIWRSSDTIEYSRAIGIGFWEGLWGDFSGGDPNLELLDEWVDAFRVDSWSGALSEHGIEDRELAGELASRFPREVRRRLALFPDAAACLHGLGRSHELALVTNGAPAIQREKIDAVSIEDYFQRIVISGEIGIGKPDPAIFQAALDGLDVSPEQTVMVGNSLHRDIAGAQAVGIRAVWLNRAADTPAGSVSPDAEAPCLARVAEIVE
jgi:putative hydrolase of the HAD superfamily